MLTFCELKVDFCGIEKLGLGFGGKWMEIEFMKNWGFFQKEKSGDLIDLGLCIFFFNQKNFVVKNGIRINKHER